MVLPLIYGCMCMHVLFEGPRIMTPVQITNPLDVVVVIIIACHLKYLSYYLDLQLWTLRLAWTFPKFAPTPSSFTGWLRPPLSPATALTSRRRPAGGQKTRGCPQAGTTSLWPDWHQRQSIWCQCMLSTTTRRVSLWLAHRPPVSFHTGFHYNLFLSSLSDTNY